MSFSHQPIHLSDPEHFVDLKRKIVVNTRNMTSNQQLIYKRNFYTNQRPDLTEHDFFVFKEKLKLGELYMNEMRKRLNNECRRIFFQTSGATRRLKSKYIEDQVLQLSPPHIKGARFHADRNWQEASKIVNYIDIKLSRLSKYGLDYPIFTPHYKVDDCLTKEDEVTQRLVREMRKAPVAAAAADDEE